MHTNDGVPYHELASVSNTTHLKIFSAFHALIIRRAPTVSFGEVPRETRGAGLLPDGSSLSSFTGHDEKVADKRRIGYGSVDRAHLLN